MKQMELLPVFHWVLIPLSNPLWNSGDECFNEKYTSCLHLLSSSLSLFSPSASQQIQQKQSTATTVAVSSKLHQQQQQQAATSAAACISSNSRPTAALARSSSSHQQQQQTSSRATQKQQQQNFSYSSGYGYLKRASQFSLGVWRRVLCL